MHYAARWETQAALPRLRETASSLAELANSVGYDSETAFSRAFKRIMGVAPGAARHAARNHGGAAAGAFPLAGHDATNLEIGQGRAEQICRRILSDSQLSARPSSCARFPLDSVKIVSLYYRKSVGRYPFRLRSVGVSANVNIS